MSRNDRDVTRSLHIFIFRCFETKLSVFLDSTSTKTADHRHFKPLGDENECAQFCVQLSRMKLRKKMKKKIMFVPLRMT